MIATQEFKKDGLKRHNNYNNKVLHTSRGNVHSWNELKRHIYAMIGDIYELITLIKRLSKNVLSLMRMLS